MSQSGQKATSARRCGMSVPPPGTDMRANSSFAPPAAARHRGLRGCLEEAVEDAYSAESTARRNCYIRQMGSHGSLKAEKRAPDADNTPVRRVVELDHPELEDLVPGVIEAGRLWCRAGCRS
jgi:hypothetical protein